MGGHLETSLIDIVNPQLKGPVDLDRIVMTSKKAQALLLSCHRAGLFTYIYTTEKGLSVDVCLT